jgi:hypothetical protein
MGSWIPAGYFKIDKFPIPRNEKRKPGCLENVIPTLGLIKGVDSDKKIHMHASNDVTSGPITLDVTSFSILSP